LKARLEVKIPQLQAQWKEAKVISDKVIHKVTVDQVIAVDSFVISRLFANE
jgi:hypothetical protein